MQGSGLLTLSLHRQWCFIQVPRLKYLPTYICALPVYSAGLEGSIPSFRLHDPETVN